MCDSEHEPLKRKTPITTSTAQISTNGDFSRVEAARRGDPDAWSELVAEFGPRIRGFARARGAPDPDDVMQDVFGAVAQRIGSFEGNESSFQSWLFSIAYRQIANRHRRSNRETLLDPKDVPAPAVAGPEDDVIRAEGASVALQALHVLNDIERDVVLMRVVAELSTDEVAAAVSKTPGNVRVIQTRALAKVRTELERVGYQTRSNT